MIAWRLLKSLIPDDIPYKANESELSIYFKHKNSTIALKGADNEDSLRGTGLGSRLNIGGLALVVDEFASMFNKWEVWNSVLRPMLTDTNSGCLFISTPKGKDAFWELYMKGQREEDDFKSWVFKTSDSPYIDLNEIKQARKELPDRYFRQEYEASFEDYTGLIWPEFNKNHIIEPIYVDKMFNKVSAIDPAISGTTGVLKAFINGDGDIIIYDEYYEPNKRVSEICPEIREEKVQWFIDPASSANNVLREGKLYSLYNEYSENGIFARTAETNVDAGINRVAEYFKLGKIKIFNTCKKLIWELERYHWAERKESIGGELKPKPYKVSDHLCDCLRYIIMSRPHKTDLTKTVKVERYSPQYFIDADKAEDNKSKWREKYKR